MDLSSGLGSPVGHCGQASTFMRAANAAEIHADRMANGKAFTCPRGAFKAPLDPSLCARWWRAKVAPCLSEAYGRCNIGALNDAKFPEDTMGKTNYGKCVECGRKGNRDSAGRCYNAACKAQRGKPKPGQEETPATPGNAGEMGSVSGRDLAWAQPFEKIEELPTLQVEPETAGASPEVEGCRSAEEAQVDRTFQASRALIASGAAMLSPEEREHLVGQPAVEEELPEDLDRPFTVAGIEFEPARKLRVIGKPLVSIRAEHFSFLTGVVEQHRLRRFTHARLAASVDGQAVAIKFYDKPRQGAQRLTGKHGGLSLAAAAFLREHPGMRLRQGAMEETEWDGLFVVRLSEREAA